MSLSTVTIPSTGQFISTETSLTHTPEAIKGTSTTFYSLTVDNSANGGAVTYISLYNNNSGNVSVGVSAADIILMIPAGAVETFNFFTGKAPGITLSVALTMAATTTSGGSTSPSSAVIVTVTFA